MEKQEEVLGYGIKKTDFVNQSGERVRFVLTGKRGAKYNLCEECEYLYFVRNEVGNIVGLKGNYTFTTSSEYRKRGRGVLIGKGRE